MKDLEESLEIISKPHTVFRLRLTAPLIKDFLIKTSITTNCFRPAWKWNKSATLLIYILKGFQSQKQEKQEKSNIYQNLCQHLDSCFYFYIIYCSVHLMSFFCLQVVRESLNGLKLNIKEAHFTICNDKLMCYAAFQSLLYMLLKFSSEREARDTPVQMQGGQSVYWPQSQNFSLRIPYYTTLISALTSIPQKRVSSLNMFAFCLFSFRNSLRFISLLWGGTLKDFEADLYHTRYIKISCVWVVDDVYELLFFSIKMIYSEVQKL